MARSIRLREILRSRALVASLLCVFLGALDLTVIASILSTIIPDLGVNTADIDRYIWVVNGYLIAYIVAIPLVGRLSDLLGRRAMFVGCLVIFAAGSLICARASSLDALVAGRTIQGLGGGGLLPVTLALTGDILPARARLAGIGLVSAVDTLGWVLGPTYGAIVVEALPRAEEPWRWIFWLNIPLLAVALTVVAGTFPADDTKRLPLRRLDLPGALLLTAALVMTNLALASGGEVGGRTGSGLRALGGTPNPLSEWIPLLLFGAAICAIALLAWERRVKLPILPAALLTRAVYLASVAANFLIGAVLMVGMVNVPVIVALVRDPDSVSRDSAALLAPFTLSIAVFSLLSGPIAARIGTRAMTVAGVGLTAFGFLTLYLLVDREEIWRMAIGLLIAGVGVGLLLAPLGAVALDQAAPEDRGAAASTALMFRLLGMTLGISALTATGVARLQHLTGRLDPVVRGPDESTAAFLERQRRFIEEHAIPLAVQVIQETFLIAAAIALLAVIPILRMQRRPAGR